jgi:hypothetical protein
MEINIEIKYEVKGVPCEPIELIYDGEYLLSLIEAFVVENAAEAELDETSSSSIYPPMSDYDRGVRPKNPKGNKGLAEYNKLENLVYTIDGGPVTRLTT